MGKKSCKLRSKEEKKKVEETITKPKHCKRHKAFNPFMKGTTVALNTIFFF